MTAVRAPSTRCLFDWMNYIFRAPKNTTLPSLPEPADLPEVGEHLPAGHVLQHHVEVRVVLWGRKRDDSTNKMDKTATDTE